MPDTQSPEVPLPEPIRGFRIERRSQGQYPGFGRLYLECSRGMDHVAGKKECPFSLWGHAPSGAMWQWDGNEQAPTIAPSIDCRGGCGRHFMMVQGVPK
jgi:uncharacterized protein DUF6527